MTTIKLTDQEWKDKLKNPATQWKDKTSADFVWQNRLLTMCTTQKHMNTFVDKAVRNRIY